MTLREVTLNVIFGRGGEAFWLGDVDLMTEILEKYHGRDYYTRPICSDSLFKDEVRVLIEWIDAWLRNDSNYVLDGTKLGSTFFKGMYFPIYRFIGGSVFRTCADGRW